MSPECTPDLSVTAEIALHRTLPLSRRIRRPCPLHTRRPSTRRRRGERTRSSGLQDYKDNDKLRDKQLTQIFRNFHKIDLLSQ